MKKILSILLLSSSFLHAQNFVLYSSNDGKIGLKDKKGSRLTEPVYDRVSKINDDYSIISRDGKNGVVDKNGKVIIKEEYDYIFQFSENKFSIRLDDGCGHVDLQGNVMGFKCTYADVFLDGISIITIGSWNKAVIDESGKVLYYLRDSEIATNMGAGIVRAEDENEKRVYFNKSGTVISSKTNSSRGAKFSEGLIMFESDKKYGYMNPKGETVITPQFEDARSFYKGMALVTLDKQVKLIDKQGKVVKNLEYDFIYPFHSDDLAIAKKDKEISLIKRENGDKITDIAYEDIDYTPRNKKIILIKLNGKWGAMDRTGKILVKNKYDGCDFNYNNSNYVGEINKKFGLISVDFEEMTPFKYDEIKDLSDEKYSRIKINNKYGYMNQVGYEILPVKYDAVSFFNKNTILAELNGEKTYFNTAGIKIDKPIE